MKKHEMVQKNDDDRLNNNLRDEVTIARKYKEHRPEYLKLLKEFRESETVILVVLRPQNKVLN